MYYARNEYGGDGHWTLCQRVRIDLVFHRGWEEGYKAFGIRGFGLFHSILWGVGRGRTQIELKSGNIEVAIRETLSRSSDIT
jgi:hypothetical protein